MRGRGSGRNGADSGEGRCGLRRHLGRSCRDWPTGGWDWLTAFEGHLVREGAAALPVDDLAATSHARNGSRKSAPRVVSGGSEGNFEDPLITLPDKARSLLLAAKRLLVEGGYEALTLNAIAACSGENKALIAYHFGNKQGLVGTLLDCVIHDSHRAFQDHLHSLWPEKHSAGLTADACPTNETQDGFRSLVQLLPHVLHDQDLCRRVAQLHESNVRAVLDRLARAEGPGVRPDSAQVGWARLCCAAIDGLAVQTAVDPGLDLWAPYALLSGLLEAGRGP